LSEETIGLLEQLVAEPGPEGDGTLGGGRAFFNELKQDPGAPGLESLLAEVAKLQRVRGWFCLRICSRTSRNGW
jgi:hypothetical protein